MAAPKNPTKESKKAITLAKSLILLYQKLDSVKLLTLLMKKVANPQKADRSWMKVKSSMMFLSFRMFSY